MSDITFQFQVAEFYSNLFTHVMLLERKEGNHNVWGNDISVIGKYLAMSTVPAMVSESVDFLNLKCNNYNIYIC